MIALDTNVLVRIFVDDTADALARRQNERARTFVARLAAAGEQFFVSDVVVCEAAWVLRSRFKLRNDDVIRFVEGLLTLGSLVFESRDRLVRALSSFAPAKGDFADYLIREHARDAGCEHVVTFDEALLREDGFRAP